MARNNQARLSLVAPSGSGKSTLAGMLKQQFESMGLTVAVLKLAQPLYEIQASFYEKSLVDVAKDKQNQRLLEIIATEMRRIDPYSLINNFQQRLDACQADVIINDDLRDDQIDWPHLQRQGFKILRIVASGEKRAGYLNARGDLSIVKNSNLNQQIACIRADLVLVNNASLDDLAFQARGLVQHLSRSGQWGRHALA
ncbi:MAG: dephospho-CoA kinase [Pseudomonadota bacterium]